jgi:hypothetical protein
MGAQLRGQSAGKADELVAIAAEPGEDLLKVACLDPTFGAERASGFRATARPAASPLSGTSLARRTTSAVPGFPDPGSPVRFS